MNSYRKLPEVYLSSCCFHEEWMHGSHSKSKVIHSKSIPRSTLQCNSKKPLSVDSHLLWICLCVKDKEVSRPSSVMISTPNSDLSSVPLFPISTPLAVLTLTNSVQPELSTGACEISDIST
jgi:hypothetical protein